MCVCVCVCVSVVVQLQDAERKKFGKCEHIDMDWGVDGDDEDIYQTPTTASQPQPSSSIKRSDTTGNISGEGQVKAVM